MENNNRSGAATIIIISCATVLALSAAYLVYYKKTSDGKKAPGGQQGAVTVRSMTAEVQTLHDYVNTNGEIKTQSSIEVFPDNKGKIVETYVSLGTAVKRGSVIAEIDPSEPGMQFAHSRVYSPISGTVTAAPLKPGTKVTTSTAITVIGDVANLQVNANIPERFVAALKIGLKANIILEAYPNEIFTATVSRISPVVDSTSRTKEIILTFDQNDPRINAGMFAKVTLYTLDYEGFPVIPSNCIVTKGGKEFVYSVNADGETVSRKEIQTGETVDNMTQVKSGISAGEKIVIEGQRVLSDGSKINDITDGIKKPQAAEQAKQEEKDGKK
ncbi:MAG: efflux RND transporter periplasmic adaptor subunit [Treponema sp.]|nr:efflux RND transporter periplasmic adaptor subunit [Treponema sp.]